MEKTTGPWSNDEVQALIAIWSEDEIQRELEGMKINEKAHGEPLDEMMKGMSLGLLIAHEGLLQDPFPHAVFDMTVVVEETFVVHQLGDVAKGFAVLMGVIYCLNHDYPTQLKYFFELLRKVIMKIGEDHCSARIHNLRNKLLRYTA
ncbi:hypothetical protein AAFF_G00343660 [Aldrovandia affinis]|uniref:Uncharacterized protein n=1 Tax=Aldrovandia affinis TaxID=143900 RepID=A0AAD7SM57_9TELE|nr:hypothetical protein AAFF_G00343660 [Aldrovandia affinis]